MLSVRRLSLVASVAMAAGIAPAVPAQNARAFGNVTLADRAQPSRTRDVLDTRASVDIVNQPVRNALNEIALQANVRLVYTGELGQSTRLVTLRRSNAPVRELLTAVLQGTGFAYTLTETGQILIARGQAAADGVITGKVTNGKTNQPLSGVAITVDDASRGVATDADGNFTIRASVGEHTIHIRRLGFTKQTKRVTVTEDGTVAVTIALEPSTSVLDEVVVTGTVVATERKAIPTPITVITAADIEKRGITRVDQLLRGEVPGVIALETGMAQYTSDSLGSMAAVNVYSRGTADLSGKPSPLKTYVDGVELLNPAYLGTIDPKSIERIEIITGPQASTIYGSGAAGGVMQIFTKKGESGKRPEIVLNLKYGVLKSNLSNGNTPAHNHSVSINGSAGPAFTYAATGSYNYTGEWQPGYFNRMYGASVGANFTTGKITTNASFATTAGGNGMKYSGWYGIVPLGSSILDSKMRETGVLFPSAYDRLSSPTISTSATQTMALTVDYRPFSVWQHHVTVGRVLNAFEIEPQKPGFIEPYDSLYRGSSANGQRTTLSYNTSIVPSRLGPMTTTLTLGANGSFGGQTNLSGCLTTLDATLYVPCTRYESIKIAKPVDDKNWGGFGSWQVGLFDQLYLTLGLRAERNPNYGENHKVDWTPTNGLTYTMSYGDVTLKMLGSYGRATRPPQPSMRLQVDQTYDWASPRIVTTQIASPDLKPQYSEGPQGGIELYYGNLGSLSVNHYRQNVTNLIQQVEVDTAFVSTDWADEYPISQFQYLNVGKIRQEGWDATLSTNVGPLSLKGTYSWSATRLVTCANRCYFWQGIGYSGVPTHIGSMIVSYARGGTSVTLTTNYIGASEVNNLLNLENYMSQFYRLAMYGNRVWTWDMSKVTKPGYTKSDLAASQYLASWASFTVNVTNLGNTFDSDVGPIFPALGRQAQFGVALRFPRTR